MNWLDIVNFAKMGKIPVTRRVEKTKEEWKAELDPEVFRVTRQHGTERPFTGAFCEAHDAALYACSNCKIPLFDSRTKFESGTGWPSFTLPVTKAACNYVQDRSHGMVRTEVQCSTCDAHLGHVFPDGPMPSGLRFCINSVSLEKVETAELDMATFGGGCFWCTEAMFKNLKGVKSVVSGYSGGQSSNPSYEQVCKGTTGHAEVIQVVFDPSTITFEDLVRIHLHTHNPTTLNQQGADKGTQYRSAIFYHTTEQQDLAAQVIAEEQTDFDTKIVTELAPYVSFHIAEGYHQDYYARHNTAPYCAAVIAPKLRKLKEKYANKIKDSQTA